VHDYLDTVRPVTVKDFFVVAPIPQPLAITIANLNPDNEATRAEVIASLQEMLFEKASPGQTIFIAWKSYAIMNAPNVISFDLLNAVDDVMPDAGHLAVLGNVLFTSTPTGLVAFLPTPTGNVASPASTGAGGLAAVAPTGRA
jgi:hypothetical protein